MPARPLACLALVLGLAAAPLSRAADPAPPPADFYGTWYDALSHTPGENTPVLDEQVSTGLGTIRQYVFWDRIETSPGAYDWRRLDEVVRDTTARGITIVPTLVGYTPAFYTTKPAGAKGTTLYPPKDNADLARFATALIERYGPRGLYWCHPFTPQLVPEPLRSGVDDQLPCDDAKALRTWEVWNEPDYKAWWGGRPNAREYAAMLTTVSAAIKKADPGAEVVMGSITGAGAATKGGFLDQLYAAGAGPAFDTIAFNPYASSVADMVKRVRDARAVAARHGDAAKPIRILEYGWATGGRGDATVVTPTCQAALLYAGTRRLAELRSELGIRGIVQFQWRDAPVKGSTSWPDHAGVRTSTGAAKPSLAAFSAAVAGQPAPAGATLAACPAARRAVA